MYAVSNDKYLTFYNIFAVLKITIPCDGVKTVNLFSDVPLSGKFRVVESQEEETELKRYIAMFYSDVTDSRDINFPEPRNEGDFIYVAVPAAVEYYYLRIRLFDEYDHEMGCKHLNLGQVNNVLEVNKIYTVGTDWDIFEE